MTGPDLNPRVRALRIVQAHAARRPIRGVLAGIATLYAAFLLDLAERLLGVPSGAMLAARIEVADLSARGALADQTEAEAEWVTRTFGDYGDGPAGSHPSGGRR